MKVKFKIKKAAGWRIPTVPAIYSKGISDYVFSHYELSKIQDELFEYIDKNLLIDACKITIEQNIRKRNKSLFYNFIIDVDIEDDVLFLLTLTYSKEILNSYGMIF